MKGLSNAPPRLAVIDDEAAGQRIDNWLLRELKGVPRSHVYRLLRSGEVRVDSRRVHATHRLRAGERVRVPPVRTAMTQAYGTGASLAKRGASERAWQALSSVQERSARPSRPQPDPGFRTIYEDEALLVIDKPAGVAVHGGSGVSFGVIERLRAARPGLRFLELVHRLDRETSGLLMLAKRRAALTAVHADLREGRVRKQYLALVKGAWRGGTRRIVAPLRRYVTAGGERRVSVDRVEGLPSSTVFEVERQTGPYTLLRATLETGRTHQIRVHLAHAGHPILGDDKYGDFALNKALQREGLKRMFLHAGQLELAHPLTREPLALEAPLPRELADFLHAIEVTDAETV